MRYEIQINMRVLSFQEQLSLLAAGVGLLFDRLKGERATTAVAEATVDVVEATAVAEPDDLTTIKGIGPTFNRRLQEAGVTSFAHLAALTPERARELSGATNWQADTAEWVVEAKKLAEG
jgi:predicted flap endonuclease-1-like 5' DNA nuclease